jgi:hypothetical protein
LDNFSGVDGWNSSQHDQESKGLLVVVDTIL